jgi:enamine deaminase RidA (YjgF/YER057c/UK114 family)
MERRIINPPALAPPRGYTHGILVTGGRLLFLGGQDSSDAEGRIVGAGDLLVQFEQALKNLHAVVHEAGGTMTDIMKLNIFVRRREDYLAQLKPLGRIFRSYFGGHYPTMAFFQVSGFFHEEALVELEGLAVIQTEPSPTRL